MKLVTQFEEKGSFDYFKEPLLLIFEASCENMAALLAFLHKVALLYS